MVAARSELLGGDHRLLYLAWLMGIQWDHVDDEDTEPPVPAGLADLSGALRAIADFLEIDEDLIAVAAEASPPLKEEPAAGLADWIATLPAAEKDKLLTMVADGEGPQVQAILLRRFRGSAPARTHPPTRPDGSPAVGGGRGTQDRPRGSRGAGPPRRRRTRGSRQSRRLRQAPGPSRHQEPKPPGRRPRTSSRRRSPATTTRRSRCCATCPPWPAATATTTHSPPASCSCGPGTNASHHSKNASTRQDSPDTRDSKARATPGLPRRMAQPGGMTHPALSRLGWGAAASR